MAGVLDAPASRRPQATTRESRALESRRSPRPARRRGGPRITVGSWATAGDDAQRRLSRRGLPPTVRCGKELSVIASVEAA